MSDLKDFVIKDGVLKKYVGTDTEVVVPDSVTEISSLAFNESKSISSVTIPDSVVTVQDGAFKNCYHLADENGFVIIRGVMHGYFGGKMVRIPEGVKRIGNNAFAGNNAIHTVMIPQSVTEIGMHAFWGCANLLSIAIPDTVRKIEPFAFSECASLADENGFVVVNHILYSYYGTDAIVIIPNGVKHIGDLPFFLQNIGNKFITSIVLPQGLESISENAFQCCSNLTQITIPDSVKQIGNCVFVKCDKLDAIIASDGIIKAIWPQLSTKQKNNIILKAAKDGSCSEFLKEKMKEKKQQLIEIALSEDNAQLMNSVITAFVKIPLGELNRYIQKAGSSPQVTAFLLDYKNTTYSVDEQERQETNRIEKELGLKEFSIADWKKIFNCKKTDKGLIITGYKGENLDVTVPAMIGSEKVIEIADDAFSPVVKKLSAEVRENRLAIRSVNVAFGVKKIGKRAFYDCKNLQSVQIADSVTSIGDLAFRGCVSLTIVSLPKKIKAISKELFYHCYSLTEITLPNCVISMGNFAFCGCKKLEKIILPDSLAKINKEHYSSNRFAFEGCENLTIHAPAGSYAEQYAKENNIPFVAE